MTAFGSIETAVEAVKLGAASYLTKPLDVDAVSALVGRAIERSSLSEEASRLREEVKERYAYDRIVGNHPSMQRLMKQVAQVASSRATVLLEGETGTGKELIAAAIHHHSKRADGPFVRLNCAALAETLLESELFGHERGAFTGAAGRRRGRFEQADGGTLFLDEVSEIPASVQVKLLRFLQEREFERVGGNETVSVDVRVVAATNRRLEDAVADGEFREDLFYRLNVVKLQIPPLRARRTDIPTLAQHFLEQYAEANERDVRGFTPEALQHLTSYGWPGNVRELENTVERAVVFAEGRLVNVDAFPVASQPTANADLSLLIPGLTLAELERMAIERTLEAVGGSTAKAAQILGISQRKIQYRVKEWGLD
jgi:DNA-binding NtrC family response regulator